MFVIYLVAVMRFQYNSCSSAEVSHNHLQYKRRQNHVNAKAGKLSIHNDLHSLEKGLWVLDYEL